MNFLIFILAASCCLELTHAGGKPQHAGFRSYLGGWFSRGAIDSRVDYEAGFEEVHKYLKRNVETYDIETNLNAAARYLKTEGSKLGPSTVEALKLFTALDSRNLCTEKTVDILVTIDEALNHLLGRSNFASLRGSRVDGVLSRVYYELKHSCKDLYTRVVAAKNKCLNPTVLRQIKTFVDDAYAEVWPRDETALQVIRGADQIPTIDFGGRHAPFFLRKLVGMSKGDSSNHAQIIKLIDGKTGNLIRDPGRTTMSALRSAFVKYFVKPCEQHNQMLPQHLFQPLIDRAMALQPEHNELDREYFESYRRYKTCARLFDKSDKGGYTNLVEELVAFAMSMS